MQSDQGYVGQLRESYGGKTAIKKLALINSFFNEKYKREQSIADHVDVLELQFALLATIETKLDC